MIHLFNAMTTYVHISFNAHAIYDSTQLSSCDSVKRWYLLGVEEQDFYAL